MPSTVVNTASCISPTTAQREGQAQYTYGLQCLSFTAAAILTFTTCGCDSDLVEGPLLRVEPSAQEIHAAAGGPAVAQFVLTNRGDALLQIEDVEPGCGCAVAELPSRTLHPGESTTLTVEVTPAALGSRRVVTTIRSNSAVAATVPVEITCWPASNEPRIVRVSPDRLIINGTVHEVSQPRGVSITSVEPSERVRKMNACTLN